MRTLAVALLALCLAGCMQETWRGKFRPDGSEMVYRPMKKLTNPMKRLPTKYLGPAPRPTKRTRDK